MLDILKIRDPNSNPRQEVAHSLLRLYYSAILKIRTADNT